ncbi:hypothetical protein PMAYCL1PPCAC_03281, partial [Pristionchus mayeri]
SLLCLLLFSPLISSFILLRNRPNIPVTLPPVRHQPSYVTFGDGITLDESSANSNHPYIPFTYPPSHDDSSGGFTPDESFTFGMGGVTPDGIYPLEENDDATTDESVTLNHRHHGFTFDDVTVDHHRTPPPLVTDAIVIPPTDPSEPPARE